MPNIICETNLKFGLERFFEIFSEKFKILLFKLWLSVLQLTYSIACAKISKGEKNGDLRRKVFVEREKGFFIIQRKFNGIYFYSFFNACQSPSREII